MLGANERKTLSEIERQLIDDDQEFRRSFNDIGRRSPYSLRWAYAMPRYVRRDLARTASPPGRPAVADPVIPWSPGLKEVRPMIRHTGCVAGIESHPRREVSYWCVNGHYTPSWPCGHADAPHLWDCRPCSLPAGQDPANPPEPLAVPQFKTPIGYLLERRTEAECEALLAEALQRLRTYRHSRARGPQSCGSWS